MEWDHDIDLSRRKYTSRLIVERALSRGWRIYGFKTNPGIFLIYAPNKAEPIKIFSASPPGTSYPSAKIAKDKYITCQILKNEGINVPDEIIFKSSNLDHKVLDEFIDIHKQVVMKPLSESHGNGVVSNISSVKQIEENIRLHNFKDQSIILQEMLQGFDIRIALIDYKFAGAIHRKPASVIGDGKKTIRELIELENNSDSRGDNYKAELNKIPIKRAENFLGQQGMEIVPDSDQEVQVVDISNIGVGGTRHNISNLIPDFLKEESIKIAKIFGLPVVGIDYIVSRIPNQNDSADDFKHDVIELNECPMLTLYDDVQSDEQKNIIDLYLDSLVKY